MTLSTGYPYDQYSITLPALIDPTELIIVTAANTSATVPSFVFVAVNGAAAVGPFNLSTPFNVSGLNTGVSAVNVIAVTINASATSLGSNGGASVACTSTDVFTLTNPTANSGCQQLDPLAAMMVDPTTAPPSPGAYAAPLSPLSTPFNGDFVTSISIRIGTGDVNNTIRLFVYDMNTGNIFAQTAAFFYNATASGTLQTITLPVIATNLTALSSSANIFIGIAFENPISELIGFVNFPTNDDGLALDVLPQFDPTQPIPDPVPAPTSTFPTTFVAINAFFTTNNCTYFAVPAVAPSINPQTSCFQSALDVISGTNDIHVPTAFPNETYVVRLTSALTSTTNLVRIFLPTINVSLVNTSISVTLNGLPNGPFPLTLPFTAVSLSGFTLTTAAVNTIIVSVTQSVVFPIDNPFITTPTSSFCSNVNTFSVINPTASQMVGDPIIVGLSGQSFQIHGIDGGIYNLISAPTFNLNSEFIFLTGPRLCPIMPSTGRRAQACWTHAGSYLFNLGLVTNSHRILIESGAAATGFARVQVDDDAVAIGETLAYNDVNVTLTLTSSHECLLQIGVFRLSVESIDNFLNIRSIALSWPLSVSYSTLEESSVHGLIGQTWRPSPLVVGKMKVIDGDSPDEYLLSSQDLYGRDFEYNRYEVTATKKTTTTNM